MKWTAESRVLRLQQEALLRSRGSLVVIYAQPPRLAPRRTRLLGGLVPWHRQSATFQCRSRIPGCSTSILSRPACGLTRIGRDFSSGRGISTWYLGRAGGGRTYKRRIFTIDKAQPRHLKVREPRKGTGQCRRKPLAIIVQSERSRVEAWSVPWRSLGTTYGIAVG